MQYKQRKIKNSDVVCWYIIDAAIKLMLDNIIVKAVRIRFFKFDRNCHRCFSLAIKMVTARKVSGRDQRIGPA